MRGVLVYYDERAVLLAEDVEPQRLAYEPDGAALGPLGGLGPDGGGFRRAEVEGGLIGRHGAAQHEDVLLGLGAARREKPARGVRGRAPGARLRRRLRRGWSGRGRGGGRGPSAGYPAGRGRARGGLRAGGPGGGEAHARPLSRLDGRAVGLQRAEDGVVYGVEDRALVGELDLRLGRVDVDVHGGGVERRGI